MASRQALGVWVSNAAVNDPLLRHGFVSQAATRLLVRPQRSHKTSKRLTRRDEVTCSVRTDRSKTNSTPAGVVSFAWSGHSLTLSRRNDHVWREKHEQRDNKTRLQKTKPNEKEKAHSSQRHRRNNFPVRVPPQKYNALIAPLIGQAVTACISLSERGEDHFSRIFVSTLRYCRNR